MFRRRHFLGLMAVALGVTLAVRGSGGAGPGTDPATNAQLLVKLHDDPDEWQRFRRQLALFRSLPPERQARLRELDRELHAEPTAKQTRLTQVLERYAAWVDQLPPESRARLEQAKTVVTRRDVVKQLRDEQYVAQLPESRREELRSRPDSERSRLLERWRREARWLADDLAWLDARAAELPTTLPAPPEEFIRDVWHFGLGPARSLLSAEEIGRWQFASAQQRHGILPLLRIAAETAAAHKLPDLPGTARGAQYLQAAHIFARKHLKDAPFPQRRLLPKPSENDIWPDYALRLTNWAREFKVTLPRQYGPATSDELTSEYAAEGARAVREFLDVRLPAVLTEDEKNQLKQAHGRWPDYPQKLVELCKKYALTFPGLKLPGPPEFWAAMHGKPTPALPTPAEADLRAFVLANRVRFAGLTLADPGDRLRILSQYFDAYPDELSRLRLLDLQRTP